MHFLRFNECRKELIERKRKGQRGRHERVNLKDYIKKEESKYIDVYDDFKWVALDKFLKDRGMTKLRTKKAKIAYVESLGLSIQCDDDGKEGVAISVNEEGVKNMRRGQRIAVTREKKSTYEDKEEADEDAKKYFSTIQVAAHSEEVSFNILLWLLSSCCCRCRC